MSVLWLDKKYLNLISNKFGRFVWKSPSLANCRCMFCGDSKKKTNKARGYFYEKKGAFIYHCHNCNITKSFFNILKTFEPSLYREYLMENYKNKSLQQKDETFEGSSPIFSRNTIKTDFLTKLNLPSIESLSDKHYAKSYIRNRSIPKKFWNTIYFTDDFRKFIDEYIPNHGKKLIANDPRIVIPFYDAPGNLLAVQGRSLSTNDYKLRYMTIKFDENSIKVFGLDRFDKEKPGYIVEGPFDSMFLENSIATAGADLSVIIGIIDKDLHVLVQDNEPRNIELIKMMARYIKNGFKIVIWPDDIIQKDINDMILAGYTNSEIMTILDRNTFSDLEATFRLNQWKKL